MAAKEDKGRLCRALPPPHRQFDERDRLWLEKVSGPCEVVYICIYIQRPTENILL